MPNSYVDRVRTALPSGSASAAFGGVVGRAGTVCGSLALAARTPSADFGRFAVASAAAVAAASVLSLGMPAAVAQRAGVLGDGEDDVTSALGLVTTISFSAAGLILLSADPISQFLVGSPTLTSLMRLASLYVATAAPQLVLAAALLATGRYRQHVAMQIARGCIAGAVLVFAAIIGSVEAGVLGLGVAEFSATIMGGLPRVLWRWLTNNRRKAVLYRPLLRLGGAALASGVTIQAALTAGVSAVAREPGGFREAAFFGIGQRLQTLASFFLVVVAPLAISSLTRAFVTDLLARGYPLVRRYLRAATLVSVPAIFAAIGLGIDAHANGRRSSAVAAIMLLTVLPISMNNVGSQALYAQERLFLWLLGDCVLAAAILAGGLLPERPTAMSLSVGILGGYVTASSLQLVAALSGFHKFHNRRGASEEV